MRVWLLGLEPLEERYTEQWDRWFPRELKAAGVDVRKVEGDRIGRVITTGQFLDAYDTNVWKATQAANFIKLLRTGDVRDEDVVLLTDAWNPALEMLAYTKQVAGHGFKMAGIFHAGTYDRHDLLAQKGLGSWAEHTERAWLDILDTVFVATEFHKELLLSRRGGRIADSKVSVTGLPLFAGEWAHFARPWSERGNFIVFPHRLAPEKQPEVFADLECAYRAKYGNGVSFVRTKDVITSKAHYYRLLGNAKVAFSAALQETWGIAMLEAQSLGAWPIAPNRLSYPETVGEYLPLYESLDQAVEMVRRAMLEKTAAPYDGTKWETSVARMVASLISITAPRSTS